MAKTSTLIQAITGSRYRDIDTVLSSIRTVITTEQHAKKAIERAVEKALSILLKEDEIEEQEVIDLIVEELTESDEMDPYYLDEEEDDSDYEEENDLLSLISDYHYAVGESLFEMMDIEDFVSKERFREFLLQKYANSEQKKRIINGKNYTMPNIDKEGLAFYGALKPSIADDSEKIETFMIALLVEYMESGWTSAIEAKNMFIKKLTDEINQKER